MTALLLQCLGSMSKQLKFMYVTYLTGKSTKYLEKKTYKSGSREAIYDKTHYKIFN